MVRAWSVAMGTAGFNHQVLKRVAMVFPSRFQCCWSLFWFCVCLLPQKGCGVAHGYPVSSHAVVFDPHPSEQLYSGGSFTVETDSGVGAMKPSNHINVDSPHIRHKHGDDASSVINAGDEIKPENSPVQRSKYKKTAYLHPLPLLVKQTQKETFEGLSFPTVQYFKQFVESIKNSYLTPGNDPSRYFQTAREVMENEFSSNAQDPTTDYRPDSSEENSDQDGTWSESMNSVENEPDVPFQQLTVPHSAPSTAGSSFHKTQDSDLNTRAQLAADRAVYKGGGSSEAGDLSTAAGAQSRDTHPGSLRPREHTPSGSLFGQPPSAEALISPADGADPDLDPKISEEMIQESDSEDSLHYENPSGGFQLEGFQKKDPREKIPADVLYSPKASPHVGHINNGNVSGGVPKERKGLSSTSQTHQSPAGGEESKGLDRSIASSASSHASLYPWGHRGQASDQFIRPKVFEYEAFGRRQPLRSKHAEQNTIFGVNEVKQMSDHVQAFGSEGSGSAGWASPPYKVDYGLLRSFFTPRKDGVTLKGGFVSPAEAAIPHTSMQDTIHWPPHPTYAFKRAKSGAFQRRSGAGRGHFYQTGDGLSLPFYTTKTTSNYFRRKVSFSKTSYAPHQSAQN